jgi:hypothetical protein
MNRAISPAVHAVAPSDPGLAADASSRSRNLQRQIAAILWIALASVAGTVVFELTAMGEQTKHVKFESQQDTFLGFFGDEVIRGAAKPADTDSSSL